MSQTPNSDWVIEALDLHERPLLRYASWLLGDGDVARDVVQETFLRLCREDPTRLADHVAPWLFTVCRNLALDARTKSARDTAIEAADIAVTCDLEERHDAQQALGQIFEVLETLPRNQREVVYLKFKGGLSYKEISAVTQLSITNVGFLLHTAVRAIRTRLSAHATGAGHDYSSNPSQRSPVDGIRSRRA
jgi:RNA polymerase sigma factor (sigma-70 family)